jgi:hypoxanthine phosphoribosyltransferase
MHNQIRKLRKYTVLRSISEYIYQKTHQQIKPEFYSLNDGIQACNEWAFKIPNEYDVIIGVPRAGLMFANIIACRLGRPLSTPDNFLRGEMWFSHDSPMPTEIKKVLVVEDSVGFGKQITSAAKKIKSAFPDLQVEKAGLFVLPQSLDKVDYVFEVKDEPNIFEWNMLTATWSWGDVVSSLDGVLCFECPIGWDNSPEKYLKFIQGTKPLLIPNYPLKAIVTERPESARELTESWLKRYNVKYDALVMRPDELAPNFENSVKIKSEVAKAVKPFWLWERNYEKAREIHRRSEVPVLCTQTMTLFS